MSSNESSTGVEYAGFKELAKQVRSDGGKEVDFWHIRGRKTGRFRKVTAAEGKPKYAEKVKIDLRKRELCVRFKRGESMKRDVELFDSTWEWGKHWSLDKGKRDVRWRISRPYFKDIIDGLDAGRFCQDEYDPYTAPHGR